MMGEYIPLLTDRWAWITAPVFRINSVFVLFGFAVSLSLYILLYGDQFLYLLFGGIFLVSPEFYVYFDLQGMAALLLLPACSLNARTRPLAARFAEFLLGSLFIPVGLMVGAPLAIMVGGPILVGVAFIIEVFGIPLGILIILYRLTREGYLRIRRFQVERKTKLTPEPLVSD